MKLRELRQKGNRLVCHGNHHIGNRVKKRIPVNRHLIMQLPKMLPKIGGHLRGHILGVYAMLIAAHKPAIPFKAVEPPGIGIILTRMVVKAIQQAKNRIGVPLILCRGKSGRNIVQVVQAANLVQKHLWIAARRITKLKAAFGPTV